MKYIKILKIESGCPYCMEVREENGPGCCGESSAHFEALYSITVNGYPVEYLVTREELNSLYRIDRYETN